DPRSILTLLAVALAALVILEVLAQTPSMITKIVVGIVVALALDPVVARMRDRLGGSSRGIAVAIVGTGLGMALLGVLLVLGPAAIDQAGSLRSDLPTTIEDAYTWPLIGERIAEADL